MGENGAIRSIIEASELSRLKSPLFIDCRFDLKDPAQGEAAYLKEHIPQAIYAHLDRDLCGPKSAKTGRHPLPSPAEMKENFERMGISSGSVVVAYDDSDMCFAARLWWMLQYLGHKNTYVLHGGLQAYKKRGLPTEEGRVFRERGSFEVSLQDSFLASVDEVKTASCLVDSRDPARYRGEVEPIDPIAGHIPNALNYFYRLHLDSDLRFKAPSEISNGLKSFYQSDKPPTFYCGSGVTACVNILAAVYAGLPMPKLYAGSWSEWIRDPSRPIAKS